MIPYQFCPCRPRDIPRAVCLRRRRVRRVVHGIGSKRDRMALP